MLVCSDKYKDSITAEEVNSTISDVLKQKFGDQVTTSTIILSDGGDGFLKSLTEPLSLEIVKATVKGIAEGDLRCAETPTFPSQAYRTQRSWRHQLVVWGCHMLK